MGRLYNDCHFNTSKCNILIRWLLKQNSCYSLCMSILEQPWKAVFQNIPISVRAFMFQISGMHIHVLVCTISTLYLVAWTKALFSDVLRQKLGWFIWRIWCVGHFDKTYFMQCLSRALRDENPKFLMAASTLLLPFQPLMVSAVHTGIMEASSSKLMASYSECNKRFWL